MAETPQIQDKAPKPPGLLPKRVQTWCLVGLAFLMVAIMWLTGGKKPGTPAKTATAAPVQPPLEVNEAKIADLQNRIQQLQRQQLVAESALEQQAQLLGRSDSEADQAPAQNVGAAPGDPHTEDPVAEERQRRAYLGLFASNVALSYRLAPRVPTAAEAGPNVASETDSEVARPRKPAEEPSSPELARRAPQSTEPGSDLKAEAKSAAAENRPNGTSYVLLEGTILEAVLINRLDGQFAGPIECLLSTDVYSQDRQHLLIPAGSKLLGETKKVDTFGQTRLAVLFHRLVMPDGYSVSLDQFQGLNQIGDAGLRDEVDNHYLRIFGVSLAIGALGAVAEGGTAAPLNASGSDLMRQGFAQSTAQSSAEILDKFLNLMPTITIREGHRVKVYLSGDLALPDYNNHLLPSNL